MGVRVWTIKRGGKCESSARKTPICLFGPSRERLRSRTLPPGDCSLSARSHQETERGLGLACVFVPLFLDPQYERNYKPPKRKSSPPYRGTEPGLPAISGGREVVRLDNWIQLKRRECYILRVRNNEEDKWALLGTIRGGAVYVVNNDNMPEVGPIRIQIRERADQVLDADSEEIADVSCDAMEAIRNLRDNAVHLGKDLFYR